MSTHLHSAQRAREGAHPLNEHSRGQKLTEAAVGTVIGISSGVAGAVAGAAEAVRWPVLFVADAMAGKGPRNQESAVGGRVLGLTAYVVAAGAFTMATLSALGMLGDASPVTLGVEYAKLTTVTVATGFTAFLAGVNACAWAKKGFAFGQALARPKPLS